MNQQDCIESIIGGVMGTFAKDEEALMQEAQTGGWDNGAKINAATRFADHSMALGQEVIGKDQGILGKTWDWMTNAGAKHSPGDYFLKPSEVLPKEFLAKPTEALQSWVEKTHLSTSLVAKRAYVSDVLPVFRELKNEVSGLPSHLQRYANEYINDYLRGGEFYDFSGKSSNLATVAFKNVLNNSVAFNPAVIALHSTEWLPKSMAEYGPINTAIAFAKVMKNSGGIPYREIPELAQIGVYGRGGHGPMIDSLHWVSAMNRGIYYYAGELKGGKSEGLAALDKLGFSYQPGDVPVMFRKQGSISDLALMKFAVGQARMLGSWAHDMQGGMLSYRNGKLSVGMPDFKKVATGTAALTTWAAVTAALTGAKSPIPKPLYAIATAMNPDLDEALQQIDDSGATNLFKHITGVDIAHHAQPGGLTFGVGQSIVNQAVQGVGGGTMQTLQGVSDQDMQEITEGMLKLGANSVMMLPSTKLSLGGKSIAEIGNANLKKAATLISKMVSGEIDASDPQQVQQAVTEKYFGKQEAQ